MSMLYSLTNSHSSTNKLSTNQHNSFSILAVVMQPWQDCTWVAFLPNANVCRVKGAVTLRYWKKNCWFMFAIMFEFLSGCFRPTQTQFNLNQGPNKTLRWFTPIFSVRQASPRETGHYLTVQSLLQPVMHSGLKALSYFHPIGYFWSFSTQNASLARGKVRSNLSIVWETGRTPVCLCVASPWRLSIVPDFFTVLENGELAENDLSGF